MSRAPRLRRLLRDERFEVLAVPADGDCFYTCCAKASTLGPRALCGESVQNLVCDFRDIVASAVTEDTLEFYRIASASGMRGYSECASCDNLDGLRSVIRKPKLVWADEFAVRRISEHLGVVILIVDDQARSLESKFVVLRNTEQEPCSVLILARTRRQHYNLVTLNGAGILQTSDLKQKTLSLFRLDPKQTKQPSEGVSRPESRKQASKTKRAADEVRNVNASSVDGEVIDAERLSAKAYGSTSPKGERAAKRCRTKQ